MVFKPERKEKVRRLKRKDPELEDLTKRKIRKEKQTGRDMEKNLLGLLLACGFLAGCAMGTDNVKLSNPLKYEPPNQYKSTLAYAAGPEIKPVLKEKIPIALRKLKDSRPDISCLGVKKNTYGMAMGKIDVEQGIVFMDLFKTNLIDCLETAGYKVIASKPGEMGSLSEEEKDNIRGFLDTDVRTFWVEFMPGFWQAYADSNVIFEVTLYEPKTNQEIWSEVFRGKGHVPGQVITKKGFEMSINLAYSEAMNNFYKVISGDTFRSDFMK
jgi:hypothetical protein